MNTPQISRLPQTVHIAIIDEHLLFRESLHLVLNRLNDAHFIFKVIVESATGKQFITKLNTAPPRLILY